MYKLSNHALEKLKLYSINQEEVIYGLKYPELVCEDEDKNSKIYICVIRNKLYSIVTKGNLVITVYKTDKRKLIARKRSGRWNCS